MSLSRNVLNYIINKFNIDLQRTYIATVCRDRRVIISYSLQVGDNSILLSNSTKIPGASFDQKMTLNQHITNTCKSAYFQIQCT